MPLYRDSSIGTAQGSLQDFQPTGMESLQATVAGAWESNPSVLGFDAAGLALANRGERMTGYDAANMARDAGFPSVAPADGQYTREAMDIILERKRQERIRGDVEARTPYSWTGTPVRAAATLATTLLDPLNIATAYVPTIAPARYGAMLAAAGGGAERFAIRAGVGALQGATGMAALEPGMYAAHSYLGDDYTMRDSLLNIAFGGLLGGGLHSVGGAVGDWMHPGQWTKLGLTSTGAAAIEGEPTLARTGEPAPAGSAAAVLDAADPATRNAAMRTAIAEAEQGQHVNVDPVLGAEDPTVAADRQRAPESLATGNVPASTAADERIAAQPKADVPTEAETRATAAAETYQRTRADLEARGFDPKRLAEFDKVMASFDALPKDAEALGEAVRAAANCGVRS